MTKLFLIPLLAFVASTSPAFAQMAMRKYAPQPVTTSSEVVSYFQQKKKTKKLSAQEADTLNLVSIAQDIFGVKQINLNGYGAEEKFRNIDPVAVGQSIQKAILAKADWQEQVSAADVKRLKSNSDLLKKALSQSGYSLAWVKNQQGDKDEAKELLLKEFDETHAQAMKMTSIGYEANPMNYAEGIAKALSTMTSETENKAREAKLQEMRLYLSNLPELHIMT